MGEAVKYLLGAGGLAFFAAVGGAIKWIYDGVSRREDKVETQTRRWQRDTVDRATWEAKQHDYWRDRAGRAEYVIMTRLGEDALPDAKPYPRRPRTTDDEDADTKAVER
jgi:hypothetical protein